MADLYRVEVIADNSGEFVSNGLRFPTVDEAQAYATGLALRWTLVREWRVMAAGDPEPKAGGTVR
jgi:hypothetical protein